MAVSSNHVDVMIPWLLEVIEHEQRLDEVGWSLTPSVFPVEQGTQLIWSLVLSTASPLLGAKPITMPVFLMDFYPTEAEFKAAAAEAVGALVAMRQTILTGTGQQGPNGHPLS